MNKTDYLFIKALLITTICILVLFPACEEKEFSEDYDIRYPGFTITRFYPNTALVGSEITITGTNFDRIYRVKIGNKEVPDFIVKRDSLNGEDTITAHLPRRIIAGQLYVENNYDYSQRTEEYFVPVYPPIGVFVFPEVIERERRFKLLGTNVDLLEAIRMVGESTDLTLAIRDENATPTEIIVVTVGLDIPDSLVQLQLIPFSEEVVILTPAGGISDWIPVIDPQPYDPIPPMILWDCDGETPLFDNAAAQYGAVAQFGLNLAEPDGVKKIRKNFYTVKLNVVPVTSETDRGASWAYLGELFREDNQDGGALDLSQFNDPHITYLINTNGHSGYFQFEVEQAETKYGTHDMLDFQYSNEDWEWKSFRLEDLRWEKWEGEGPNKPDPHGSFAYVKIGYTTGDIPSGSYFEISLDEIMITDGPSIITDTMYLFEDQVDQFVVSGTPTSSFSSSIDGGSVESFEGLHYQSIIVDQVNLQNEELGEINYDGPFTTPEFMNAPHVNFWINTGLSSGFIKLIAYEGTTRFIKNIGEITTDGEWKRFSVNLRAETLHEMGEPRTIDFKKLSAVGIVVTTGSAQTGQALEVNIDYVTFSDGPAY